MVAGNGSEHSGLSHEEQTERILSMVRDIPGGQSELYQQMGCLVREISRNTEALIDRAAADRDTAKALHDVTTALKQIVPRLALRERSASRPDLLSETGHDGEDTKQRLRAELEARDKRIEVLEKAENARLAVVADKKASAEMWGKRIAIIVGIISIAGALAACAAKFLPNLFK